MKLKLLIASCISLTVLSATILFGCTESPQSSSLNLVPQTANMIAEIQVNNIVNNPVWVSVYDLSPKNANYPHTVQDAINQITQKTGLNVQNFSQVLIFGDTNSMQNPDRSYIGVIGQGKFNETQLIQNIEDNTGKNITISNYKGNQLYTNINNKYSLVFFSNEMLVFGSDRAVKDCIDVSKGDAKPLSGIIIDTYNKLSQASLKAACTLTAGAKQILQNEISDSSGMFAKAISNGDTLGLSLNIGLLDVSLNLALHCPDIASAQNAKDIAGSAITLLEDNTSPGLKNLLSKIQFNTSDVWTTASLKTSLLELQSLSKVSTNK